MAIGPIAPWERDQYDRYEYDRERQMQEQIMRQMHDLQRIAGMQSLGPMPGSAKQISPATTGQPNPTPAPNPVLLLLGEDE
jgi:hypothetical protein